MASRRSRHTIRAYGGDARRFLAFVKKPLCAVTLADLRAFADGLRGAEFARAGPGIGCKSLLSFAARLGAVPFNVGAALQKVRARDTLADRILSETEINRMLDLTEGRDHALVLLAYAGGLRVSELVGLTWGDLADADDGTLFVTVYGKAGGPGRSASRPRPPASSGRYVAPPPQVPPCFPGAEVTSTRHRPGGSFVRPPDGLGLTVQYRRTFCATRTPRTRLSGNGAHHGARYPRPLLDCRDGSLR